MSRSYIYLSLALAGVFALASASSAAILSTPTDFIIPIDRSIPVSGSATPANEGVTNVRDGTTAKYLNFGNSGYAGADSELHTGFIITPAGAPAVVQSVQFRAAGDAPERDPTTFTLYGTNDPITSADHSSGSLERWVRISAQGAPTGLSTDPGRNNFAPVQNVANSTAYSSYRVLFPTVRNTTANSMQIAEAEFFTAPGGGGTALLDPSAPLVRAIDWVAPASSSPAAEPVTNLRDNNPATKYLNFGEDGSGFITTPASFATTLVDGFNITTANDAEERDPASYELYGTNDLITSYDHSRGINENWTLISSGALALPAARGAATSVGFSNALVFSSYLVVFPTVKNGATANSMQIADFQLTGVPEPSTWLLAGLGAAALAVVRRRRGG